LIYEFPPREAPIRQDDIFIRMPRVEMPSLGSALAVTDAEGNESVGSWTDIAQDETPVIVSVAVRPVTAIVTTQDCDAVRAPEIVLCEIRRFEEVEGRAKNVTSTKRLVDLITQHARINQKWFYLPPDKGIGFDSRMAVDFRVTVRVLREDLEELKKTSRVGRLNVVAEAHFRERLGEFSRRYPYDEWYSLSAEELEEYCKGREGVHPFPWQTS
jgi:hypothetical protein